MLLKIYNNWMFFFSVFISFLSYRTRISLLSCVWFFFYHRWWVNVIWQCHCDMSIVLISNEYGNSKLQLLLTSVVKIDKKWDSWTFNAALFHSKFGVPENLNVFWLSFISVSALGLYLYAHKRYLRRRYYVNVTFYPLCF